MGQIPLRPGCALIPEDFGRRLTLLKERAGLSWEGLATCIGVDPPAAAALAQERGRAVGRGYAGSGGAGRTGAWRPRYSAGPGPGGHGPGQGVGLWVGSGGSTAWSRPGSPRSFPNGWKGSRWPRGCPGGLGPGTVYRHPPGQAVAEGRQARFGQPDRPVQPGCRDGPASPAAAGSWRCHSGSECFI